MEAIVFNLKLVRDVRGVQLTYVVRQHIKMEHVFHGYNAYLNLDE